MGETAREFARAKLTRRLSIVGRRADGYHLLDAEMVSIDLCDELTFADGEGLEVIDAVAWEGSERPAQSVPNDERNLVARALALTGGKAKVTLTKHVPAGGGLGGGSADAAATLRWRGVDDVAIAAKLGADVPFCLRGGRASVGGVGEVLTPLPHDDATFVLLTPTFGVSTPAAYAAYDELERDGRIAKGLENDLEPAALLVEPRLEAVRGLFASVVGGQPLLAGSGSTYFFECPAERAEVLADSLKGACREATLSALVKVAKTTGPLSD